MTDKGAHCVVCVVRYLVLRLSSGGLSGCRSGYRSGCQGLSFGVGFGVFGVRDLFFEVLRCQGLVFCSLVV